MSTAAQRRLSSAAGNVVVLSFFVALGLGLGFLALLRRNAALCVRCACAVQVVAPLVGALGLFSAGAALPGFLFLLFSALTALVFYLWRAQLALVARLLAVASAALSENLHLVSATLGLSLVTAVTVLPLVAFIVAATHIGALGPNPEAVLSQPGGSCVDVNGAQADCCVWQVAPAAAAYIALAALTLSWSTFLAFEIRLFTIAHVVVKWYYTPAGMRVSGTPVRSALSLATGPSFGSLCLGSAILTAADMARQAADSSRQRGQNLLTCVLNSILACVAELLQLLTRFATVRIAATGESFMDGGRAVTALLQRHLLNTYGVWRFPGMVLGLTSVALSLAYSALVTLAFLAYGNGVVARAPAAAQQDAQSMLSLTALAVGFGSFFLVTITLSFLNSILINIIDSVYICFATDLDRQLVCHPEVHAVFAAVPSVRPGALVQQPDGELGYAPEPQRQHTQTPAQGPGLVYAHR